MPKEQMQAKFTEHCKEAERLIAETPSSKSCEPGSHGSGFSYHEEQSLPFVVNQNPC